jgi:hypothetical protein
MRVKLNLTTEEKIKKEKYGAFGLGESCSHLLLSGRDSLEMSLKKVPISLFMSF